MNSALPPPVLTGTKRPSLSETLIVHGARTAANATTISAPASAPCSSPRRRATRTSISSAIAAVSSRYSGRKYAVSPNRSAGERPRPRRAAVVGGPHEREHCAGHGQHRQRLAAEQAGVEERRRVDGGERRADQAHPRTGEPTAEEEHQEHRERPGTATRCARSPGSPRRSASRRRPRTAACRARSRTGSPSRGSRTRRPRTAARRAARTGRRRCRGGTRSRASRPRPQHERQHEHDEQRREHEPAEALRERPCPGAEHGRPR